MIYERPKRTRGSAKREEKALKLLSMTQNTKLRWNRRANQISTLINKTLNPKQIDWPNECLTDWQAAPLFHTHYKQLPANKKLKKKLTEIKNKIEMENLKLKSQDTAPHNDSP